MSHCDQKKKQVTCICRDGQKESLQFSVFWNHGAFSLQKTNNQIKLLSREIDFMLTNLKPHHLGNHLCKYWTFGWQIKTYSARPLLLCLSDVFFHACLGNKVNQKSMDSSDICVSCGFEWWNLSLGHAFPLFDLKMRQNESKWDKIGQKLQLGSPNF